MRELLIRAASGLVYVLVMVGSILIHPLVFLGVFLFLLVTGMMEFYRMGTTDLSRPLVWPGILSGVLIFTGVFLTRFFGVDTRILLVIPVSGLILMVMPMFRTQGQALASATHTFMGLLYVSIPLTTFNYLASHPYTAGFDHQVILLLFMVLWINDTGAYLTGKLLGKHKMFPRISPKKSWEGFAGGLALALLATWIARPLFPDIPSGDAWILSPVMVVAGTLGDLVESAWKRSAGIKDSGNIMPGHGGILDRIDSLILAAPATLITLILIK